MSTDQRNGDQRLHEYLAAVEKHAKLQQLAAALPQRVVEAERSVAEAAARIGLALPQAPRAPKDSTKTPPPTDTRPNGGGGSISERILAVLPGDAKAIAHAAGLTSSQVSGNVKHLIDAGRVVRTGVGVSDGGPGYVYHRAGEAPTE